MGKVTIQEIASRLTAQNNLSKKEATFFVNMMFETIREALERDKMVKVKGLGTFKIIDVESRESVNVNTGERVLIEGHNKITFTPDALMKELVNKPFSQFETVVLNDGVDFKDPVKEEENVEAPEAGDGESEIDEMPLVDFASDDAHGKPLEEIADEDIPEWVIEPYVTNVSEKPIDLGTPEEKETPVNPEPLAESNIPETPEVPAEPEPSMTPEPLLTPEPSKTPEPVVEEQEPTAVEEETSVTEEEPVDESSVEDEYVEEEEEEEAVSGGMRWPMILLACLISLLVGYLLGNYLPWNRQAEPKEAPAPKTEKVNNVPVQKPEAKPVAEPANQPEAKVEAPAEEAEKATPSEEKTDKPVAAPVEQPKPEVQKPAEAPKQQPVATAPAEVKLDKYEAMDSRVRTGAYRIVGLDYKEKVKEGENLQRLAKRTLGPGMECYLEVYNGLTAASPLKAGQEIKIPKVELKKKKKL